jgi:hypothetical protein
MENEKINAMLDALMKLLGNHARHYEKLAILLNQEQAALVDLDLERLQKTAKAKETLSLRIKLLIAPLSQAITESAQALGLPAEPLPTLADLARVAPAPWSNHLERASLALARLKRGIARHNEANHMFVQEALELISGSIAILTGARVSTKTGYLPNGQSASTSGYQPVKLSREV